MATLTIFANFYISDQERLLRMKDSFFSFKDIDAAKWVVNVRGQHKSEALSFLRDQLGDRLTPYLIESKQGWFHDTKQMLDSIATDFVFFWMEDHLNLIDPKKYKTILEEMKETDSEYLQYSWWFNGRLLTIYDKIPKKERENILAFTLDRENHREINKTYSTYIISMAGIFSADLFKKIIRTGPPLLRNWPKNTPFDFEKGSAETRWLPLHCAMPKYELFASIDDGGDGYSLQSRNLYPKRMIRTNSPSRPTPKWKKFFRHQIRNLIPEPIYRPLIRLVIFFNRAKNFLRLLARGL